MKSRPGLLEPLALMQLALGLFFGLTGLLFLLNYNSAGADVGRAFMKLVGKNDTLQLITAIIQLTAGGILLTGLIALIPDKYMFTAAVIIMILWGLQIIMSHFTSYFLKPDVLPWLQRLSSDLIIMAGLWGVASRYS